uniref:Putative ribonuclease H-like domain-containing protein n=1 Tax=Tanacetum cinerariifolium TaxID=118510 RepID=A0A6L2NQF4_TANCI|nr:putative ribonuclease H-like domain-containing protein [Tanacetum cinerariifolium]
MCVESVNGKKYILVIVDDYSQFTWVKFLRSKDETLDFIIKFLKMIQVRLKVLVRRIRTDNGTEFVNHTLRDYYKEVGISHETSITRSPQQNGVVERRNLTLIEAACTMLIYAQSPLFLWAKAVATTFFTQNRSIIHLRHGKTPYELMHSKLPDLSFFHVFGALCYPTNDSENLGPALNDMTLGTISSGLVQKSSPSTSYVPPSRNEQSMFDELLNPPPSVVNQAPEVIAPIAEVIPTVHANSTFIPQDVGDDNLDLEVAHIGNDPLFGVPISESMKYHSVDKRLTDLMMMVLVRQTEEYDMMLHMEKTGMLMVVAEIKVGDMTANDVDKLACSADVVKPRQVDRKFTHASV